MSWHSSGGIRYISVVLCSLLPPPPPFCAHCACLPPTSVAVAPTHREPRGRSIGPEASRLHVKEAVPAICHVRVGQSPHHLARLQQPRLRGFEEPRRGLEVPDDIERLSYTGVSRIQVPCLLLLCCARWSIACIAVTRRSRQRSRPVSGNRMSRDPRRSLVASSDRCPRRSLPSHER